MIRIGIVGIIGYETAASLMKEHEKELTAVFPTFFLKGFYRLSQQNVPEQKIREVLTQGQGGKQVLISAVREGGLLAALWDACEELPDTLEEGIRYAGCRVFAEQIPVKQEIIEICERYETDPFETGSEGAWVIIWNEDHEEGLCDKAKELIKSAEMIGYITNDKKRILISREFQRYLTPYQRQMKDINDRKNRKKR